MIRSNFIMQEEHDQPQQQYHTILKRQAQVEGILNIECSYPAILYTSSSVFQVILTLVPHIDMPNLPLQIQIRGHSNMYELNTICSNLQSLQITQSFVFDQDDKARNPLVATTNPSVFVKKNQQHHIEPQAPGQYFLEGCQVLYQVDSNKQRLEMLRAGKEYRYPVEFTLPQNLPVSLASKILKNIYMTIKYSLNIKFIYSQGAKHSPLVISLPFQLINKPKTYPQQQLILSQQLRCYHQSGKQSDDQTTDTCNKILKYICPKNFFKKFHPSQYSERYSTYDLHYVEMTVVVNRQLNLFILVRSYREPDKSELTVNRIKKNKGDISELKEENETEPPQISISSIKQINKKISGNMVNKVEVKMYGELKGIFKSLVFTKSIYLNRQNYDMIQGEAFVSLKQCLDYPHTCHNQLFDLEYSFTLRAFFEDQQMKDNTFEVFKVSESSKELQI